MAHAASTSPHAHIQPIYVSAGLAWEAEEIAMARRFLSAQRFSSRLGPLVTLTVDMRDVYPATHWAIQGKPPAYDTPDEDVYLEGRNIVLLSKASVFMARNRLSRVMLGPLAGNPFPDATPQFFAALNEAFSLGLAAPMAISAPFSRLHKEDVVKIGAGLGVPFELTLSCMNPSGTTHCGLCSKCRERRDAFHAAGVKDPTPYANVSTR